MNDIGKGARVLNNSQGRCVVCAFDKNLHEGFIWTGHRAVIFFILHKSTFLHFVHHGNNVYDRNIKAEDRKKN